MYIQLDAADPDSSAHNITSVTVSSNITDPTGITVVLTEVDISTGIYRGTAAVKSASNDFNDEIGASLGETITIISDVDTTKFISVIAIAPAITLGSPNGGEAWLVGNEHDIIWTASGVSNQWC